MLQVFYEVKQLPFGALKQVYSQSIGQQALLDYPGRPDAILQAEMDFYDYLRFSFFQTEGARCCIWTEAGRAVAALRLEPYRDGMILTGLETEPTQRGQGYARKLMLAALAQECAQMTVYSHIDRENRASIAVHEKCGFKILTNYAVYLDGSASSKADTYIRKFVNN